MIADVADLRRKAITLVALGGWLSVVVLGLLSALHGSTALWAAGISVVLNLIPTLCMIFRRTDAAARLATGFVVASQPLVVLFALQGSPLQTDLNLYLLVGLAALTMLWDTRPIILACLVIIAHHAVLIAFAPGLIFEGDGGLELFMLHSLAIALIGALLCWISSSLKHMMDNIEKARKVSAGQADKLTQTTQSLEKALEEIKIEQDATARAQAESQKLRKEGYRKAADEFESSISAVTHAVAATSGVLARTAKSLRIMAAEADKEARDVAACAESASKSAGMVAAGVAEISVSISEIAVNVSQQDELTSTATKRSDGGGKAISSLSQQSQTIGETTRAIVRVAERTNLLSLNAAIEAASAGPAGRGFTIVAQEVKALANQASNAANEIDAFLSGVHTGTLEAERSFSAIDATIGELNKAARAIRFDVENQRQSADTIEAFARNAASEADAMVGRTRTLAQQAGAAGTMSRELETAAETLTQNVRNLERSAEGFVTSLKAA